MWIKINRDLINLDHVKPISISVGHKDKYVLYFVQGEGPATAHIPFDTMHEAQEALRAVEEHLEIGMRFPNRS
jgi:hypothetical protein